MSCIIQLYNSIFHWKSQNKTPIHFKKKELIVSCNEHTTTISDQGRLMNKKVYIKSCESYHTFRNNPKIFQR